MDPKGRKGTQRDSEEPKGTQRDPRLNRKEKEHNKLCPFLCILNDGNKRTIERNPPVEKKVFTSVSFIDCVVNATGSFPAKLVIGRTMFDVCLLEA